MVIGLNVKISMAVHGWKVQNGEASACHGLGDQQTAMATSRAALLRSWRSVNCSSSSRSALSSTKLFAADKGSRVKIGTASPIKARTASRGIAPDCTRRGDFDLRHAADAGSTRSPNARRMLDECSTNCPRTSGEHSASRGCAPVGQSPAPLFEWVHPHSNRPASWRWRFRH